MSYKKIETSREIRLWITSIIVPACTTAFMAMQVPAIRDSVSDKLNSIKTRIELKHKNKD